MSVDGLTGFATSVFAPSAGGFGMNFLGPLVGLGILMVLIFFGLYIYISLAYFKIGEKAGVGSPGISWMPYGGPLAIIFEAAKARWWPFLAFVGGIVLGYILLLLTISGSGVLLFIAPAIMLIAFILFGVMTVIWHWKAYEAAGKPGWFILVPTIGFALGFIVGLLGAELAGFVLYLLSIIAHFVLIGIAAWKD